MLKFKFRKPTLHTMTISLISGMFNWFLFILGRNFTFDLLTWVAFVVCICSALLLEHIER